ncbi:MAG: sugar-binding transcriptional regulator [Firmicutes bacterium]|nr:sugar-binding transcriptional regulator [Bacillota bacterium]MDH7495299.1 sugar-binding transcriptional regulator [Bacillota bacterium]
MSFDKRVLHEIAHQYYELERTQEEIARSLGMSRSQVSRALKQARDAGIVLLKVIDPDVDYSDLARALKERFDLKDALVTGGIDSPRLLAQSLGRAAASYLARSVKDGSVIGVSWGATLREVATTLDGAVSASLKVTVVPLLGGLGQVAADLQINELAARVAKSLGGVNLYLHAPSFVDTPAAKAAIMADSNIKRVVELWEHVDVALVGVGTFRPPSTLLERGGFPDAELRELRRMGAVGDMCMRFFDVHGSPLETPLNDRIIGVTLEELGRMKKVVAVAGGANKTEAILGALRSKVVDVIITDDAAARGVMSLA